MSYILRVVVNDRPGALGEVATAIGSAGGDITGLDVIERHVGDHAVDDFLIELPPGRMPDSLVSACQQLPGVTVEFIGRYESGGTLHRDLEALEEMTNAPDRVAEVLVDLLPGIFRSGWALLLDQSGPTLRIHRATGGAPEADGFDVPWLPLKEASRIPALRDVESWDDVVAIGAPVRGASQAVIFGRDGGPPILASELARLTHLVALADVIDRGH